MRRPLLHAFGLVLLAMPVTSAGDAPAVTPAPAPAAGAAPAVAPRLPEVVVLAIVKALKDDDFKEMFGQLTPEDQATARASYAQAQLKADPKSDEGVDSTLNKLLAPNAVDDLLAQAQPSLQQFDPAKSASQLALVAQMLPLLLSQKQAQPLSPEQQALLLQFQNLLSDIATWLPTSGTNDPAKLKEALTDLIAGLKGLGVTNAAQLHQLPLDDVLAKLGPVLKAIEKSLLVYGLQADKFLASITCTGTAGATPDHRTLSVGFTAFSRLYTLSLPLELKNGAWSLGKDAIPGLDSLKQMLPGVSVQNQGGGQGEGGREVQAPDGPVAAPAPAPAPPASGPSGK